MVKLGWSYIEVAQFQSPWFWAIPYPKSATFHFRWTVDAFVWLILAEYIHGIFPQACVWLSGSLFGFRKSQRQYSTWPLPPFFKLSQATQVATTWSVIALGISKSRKVSCGTSTSKSWISGMGPSWTMLGDSPLEMRVLWKHGIFMIGLREKNTGNHSFSHEIWGFPAIFRPWNGSIYPWPWHLNNSPLLLGHSIPNLIPIADWYFFLPSGNQTWLGSLWTECFNMF